MVKKKKTNKKNRMKKIKHKKNGYYNLGAGPKTQKKTIPEGGRLTCIGHLAPKKMRGDGAATVILSTLLIITKKFFPREGEGKEKRGNQGGEKPGGCSAPPLGRRIGTTPNGPSTLP